MSEWYNHSYNYLYIFCYFLDIFLKFYMSNYVLLLFTVDKPDVKLCWWQPLRGFKGTYIYFSFFFSPLAPCELQVAIASCYFYLRLASSDLLLAPNELSLPPPPLRLATCDLRLATCDLRLATCDLQLATCDLGLPIATCELLHTVFFLGVCS